MRRATFLCLAAAQLAAQAPYDLLLKRLRTPLPFLDGGLFQNVQHLRIQGGIKFPHTTCSPFLPR